MKKTLILVHGAFAGQYAWDMVKPLLEAAGRQVITLDLPGHGADDTPPGQVTFAQYVDAVGALINAQPGPVTLMGHSMAGMVISAVAEQMPDKINKLIYLSAYLPQNGDDLQTLSSGDAESLIGRNLTFAPDYSSASLPDDVVMQVFAGDCSDDVKKLVVAKNKPEPLAAFRTKAVLTDALFGQVPKFYIETLKDEGVGNGLQKKMVAANGHVEQVFSMNCSHSAYFAKPAELVAIIEQI